MPKCHQIKTLMQKHRFSCAVAGVGHFYSLLAGALALQSLEVLGGQGSWASWLLVRR